MAVARSLGALRDRLHEALYEDSGDDALMDLARWRFLVLSEGLVEKMLSANNMPVEMRERIYNSRFQDRINFLVPEAFRVVSHRRQQQLIEALGR